MRAQQDVSCVPEYEGEGCDEPEQGDGGWGVRPAAFARGAWGAGEGFCGGEVRWREGGGVVAGGYHGCVFVGWVRAG